MKPMKIRSRGQRAAMLVPGLLALMFLADCLAFSPDLGGKIFYAVLTLAAAVFCYRAARVGLVVDRTGIVERSIGRPRRTAWPEVEGIAITRDTSADTSAAAVALRLCDGRALPTAGTARYKAARAAKIGRRLVVLHRIGTKGSGLPELVVTERVAKRPVGKPVLEPVTGPDGVPVVLRLRGPQGVDLNWSAAALPDGLLIGLALAVLIGLGTLVAAGLRELRRKPGYSLTVEVGGPEPRSATLSFTSRSRAMEHARALAAAIAERGADAAPRPV